MKKSALCCLLALCSTAWCQAPDPFDVDVSSVMLLTNKSVQKELGINEAQRASMNKQADKHRATLSKYESELQARQKKNPKEKIELDQSRIDGAMAQLKSSVLKLLNAAQIRRLREVSLQQAGIISLADEAVAMRIGMSMDQLKKVRTAYTNGMKKADSIGQAAQKELYDAMKLLGTPEPKTDADKKKLSKAAEAKAALIDKKTGPKIQKIRDETRVQVMAILTEKQKTDFKSLLGKPFKLS